MTIYTCDHCGREFARHAAHQRKRERLGNVHKFCSRECAWASPLRSGQVGKRLIRPGRQVCLTDLEVGYLAGLIDGEGSFGLSPCGSRLNAFLTVHNSDRRIIDWCLATTGVGTVHPGSAPSQPHHRQMWRWHLGAYGDLSNLIDVVVPALVSKRRQAESVAAFCRRRIAGEPFADLDYELRAVVLAANNARQAA